jgi:hypothetical protein
VGINEAYLAWLLVSTRYDCGLCDRLDLILCIISLDKYPDGDSLLDSDIILALFTAPKTIAIHD